MTDIKKLYDSSAAQLEKNGVENARNEAMWLLESICGITRADIIMNAACEPGSESLERFEEAIKRRSAGEPVQYILGEWDFYGRTFKVGSGVLIPRAETELLVDTALEFLPPESQAAVIDLCAGSGCVGLTVAAERPDAKVILVEKSEEAGEYLRRNLASLGCENARVIMGDIFDGPAACGIERADVILSNPPYIPSGEMETLQREVRREPVMALDGGDDGLRFYRAIIEKWLPVLAPGGLAAFECAENQTESISAALSPICRDIKTLFDFSSLPRAVTALKNR